MTSRWQAFRDSKALYPLLAVLAIVVVVFLGPLLKRPRQAEDFTLPLVSADGRSGPDRMRLGDQRGKVVLLDFWATWCRPCQVTTPILARLHTRYRDRGLVVMGVNVDQEGPEAVPFFARRFGVNYPVVWDDGAVSSRWQIRALPTLMLIDRQGWIRYEHTGSDTERELAEQIEKLL
jgi:thiol-disulfide isomerase/thioredoxin